ncbi:hypothetical protein RMATCC62417_14618 [Rhizopus microsporus]|nr:hypothetical protein RMATCC62417_14618 [Rhizopus microsporus]
MEQLASISSGSTGKGEDVSSLSSTSAAGEEFLTNNPASDDSAVLFTVCSISVIATTKSSERKVDDVEPEERVMIGSSPFKYSKADINESAFRSLDNDTTVNPKQISRRTVLSDSGFSTKAKLCGDNNCSQEKGHVATRSKDKQKTIEAIKEEPADANLATVFTKRALSGIVPNPNTMESLKVFTVM